VGCTLAVKDGLLEEATAHLGTENPRRRLECETKEGMLDRIERDIHFAGSRTDEQRSSFEIANNARSIELFSRNYIETRVV
jgi:hypothetical protein